MRIELLPGMTNVVRFPVEHRARPTLELLRDIAPDVREILSMAEAFSLELPAHDLRGCVDAETADFIINALPSPSPALNKALDELLKPVVERAVAACREAHDLSLEMAAAQRALIAARTEGRTQGRGDGQPRADAWIEVLTERADALAFRTAAKLIEAHTRREEAEGVARAVRLARAGEAWTVRDPRAEAEALFAAPRRAG